MSPFAIDAACPHCGKLHSARNLAAHVDLCLANADVQRRVLLALRDPDEPTRAVSGQRYNARRSMFNAPGDATLLQNYGGTWNAVCREYGLEPPLPYRSGRPKIDKPQEARARGNMKPAMCPHCGKESTAAAMGRHVPVCVANPANHAHYKALMTDYDNVGVTYSEYEARVIEHGAPAVTSLRRMTGMSAWDDILAWFGLEPAVTPANVRTCPNCGKTFKALGYAHHFRKCSDNAEARIAAQETQEETALIAYEARVLAQDAAQAQCLSVYGAHAARGGGVGYYVR